MESPNSPKNGTVEKWKPEPMKIETLREFLMKLSYDNPMWKPLETANLNAYYEVLKSVPEEVFQMAAMQIRRTKYYGWTGAADIYLVCESFMDQENNRLFTKTLNFLRENPDNSLKHDEWNKVHPVFKRIIGVGWEIDLLNMNDKMIELTKQRFCQVYNQVHLNETTSK